MRKNALAATLALALAATAAAQIATDSELNGAWVDDFGFAFAFRDGNWEFFNVDGTQFAKGTFTTDGGVVTVVVTHIHGDELALLLELDFEPEWHEFDEARALYINALIAEGYSAEEAALEFDHFFGPADLPYYVSGDTLLLDGWTYARM